MAVITRPRLRIASRFLCGLSLLLAVSADSALAQAPSAGTPAAGGAEIATLPRDLSPWGMFLGADPLVKAVLIGLAFASVVTWTVWLAKTIELMIGAPARRAPTCAHSDRRQRWRKAVEQLRATRGPAPGLSRGRVAEIQLSQDGADARRHQGAHRLAAGTDRGGLRAAHHARHRRARHHRRDRAVRRPVRHGLGHHEQLHRHLEGAHHQPRGGGARHRRSAAGDRLRAGGRDPGGRHLQRVRALDRRLSRAARRCVGRGAAAGQPRSRPPCRTGAAARRPASLSAAE